MPSHPEGVHAGTDRPPDASLPVEDLLPIDVVARRFGLRASTLRYYEDRGLLHPAGRVAGRRVYGPVGIRRVAVIRYWQEAGMLTLDEIAELLGLPDADGPGGAQRWRAVLDARIGALDAKLAQIAAARAQLAHIRSHHDCPPDGCEHYEASLAAVAPGAGEAEPTR